MRVKSRALKRRKRIKLIILIFLFFLIFFGWLFFKIGGTGRERKNFPPKEFQTQRFEAEFKINKRSQQINNEFSTILIQYPEISGVSFEKKDAVNLEILNFVEKTKKDFEEQTSSLVAGQIKEKSVLSLDYETVLISPKILSFKFLVFEYISGTPHPASYIIGLNIGLEAVKKLSLADFFSKNFDYLTFLSGFSRRILLERFIREKELTGLIKNGTEPNLENFSSFTIKDNGLIIHFSPYQVVPLEKGLQEVTVSFQEILKADPASPVNVYFSE